MRMHSFWTTRTSTVVKAQHGWTTRLVFVVWLLLSILVLSCAPAESIFLRRCRFRFGSSRFVVRVPMMFTCVEFDVVVLFHPFCFIIFAQSRVCVGCEVCFNVVYVRLFWVWFEQTDVLLFSMKFHCVVDCEFGVIWMHFNCDQCSVMWRVLCSCRARVRTFVCNQ